MPRLAGVEHAVKHVQFRDAAGEGRIDVKASAVLAACEKPQIRAIEKPDELSPPRSLRKGPSDEPVVL